MTDVLANFFLLFGKEVIIAPLCIIGYVAFNRSMWGRVIYLLFFSMLLGPLLKSIWQKPLPFWMNNDGWAFPSGHLMLSMSIYFWIAHELKSKVLGFVAIIISIGIAYSLMYKGYHDINDIAGGAFFAMILLMGYSKLNKLPLFIKRPDLIIMISLPLGALFVVLLPIVPMHTLPAFVANCIFGLSWALTYKYSNSGTYVSKIVITIITISILFFCYKLCWMLDISQPYKLIYFSAILGLVINYVPVIIRKYILSHEK